MELNYEKLDKIVEDINKTCEFDENNVDHHWYYWDYFCETDIDNISHDDTSEAIQEAYDLGLTKKEIEKILNNHLSLEVRGIYYPSGTVDGVPVGEQEYEFDELDELNDEEREYVRKSIDYYYNGKGSFVYANHNHTVVYLVLDIDKFLDEVKENSKEYQLQLIIDEAT